MLSILRKNLSNLQQSARQVSQFKNRPIKIVVTGGQGRVGRNLAFKIALGNLFGANQPINLNLLGRPENVSLIKGIQMELEDCASDILKDFSYGDDQDKAFEGADICIIAGAPRRKPGMERKDLIHIQEKTELGKRIKKQAESIDRVANINCKTVIVGNPSNTIAMLMLRQFKRINPKNITSMTRIYHNRVLGLLSKMLKQPPSSFNQLCVWGNLSESIQPDLTHATVNGESLFKKYGAEQFRSDKFIEAIQHRGTSILNAQGDTSVTSVVKATLDHINDLFNGTDGKWVSMGVLSDGNKYDIPEKLIYSFPCICENGDQKIVEGLNIDDFSRSKLDLSNQDILSEIDKLKYIFSV